MVRMEEIAREISVTWKNASLRIADVKRLIPYLAAQAFAQTGESEDDILDYITAWTGMPATKGEIRLLIYGFQKKEKKKLLHTTVCTDV